MSATILVRDSHDLIELLRRWQKFAAAGCPGRTDYLLNDTAELLGRLPTRRVVITSAHRAKARALRRDGMAWEKVAELLDFEESAIRKSLRRHTDE